ncbi:MAG: hypothetical protein M1549_02045 [Candidatus Dependentiae bacterium]|nr:hypothetical protein [Candidatus Dependentiae bacterium]
MFQKREFRTRRHFMVALLTTFLSPLCAVAYDVTDEAMWRELERYAPELTRAQDGREPFLVTLFAINRTPPEVQRSILETIYNKIIATNLYKDLTAKVRTFKRFSLCEQERATMGKRGAGCKKAVEKLLKKSITPKQLPRIGICMSGGGMRAATSGDGFLKGLAATGLLDAALYLASLSGSTWLCAPWITSGESSYTPFADELLVRVSKGILGQSFSSQLLDLGTCSTVILESFLRHLAFNELPTVIDLYGLMLGLTLLSTEDKKQMMLVDLTSQTKCVSNGQTPLPIYSAVYVRDDGEKNIYDWVEFSPFEVSCYSQGTAVPAWAFGRSFENGVSKNAAPPLPLCYLMGVWGSAISISCGELFNMIVHNIKPQFLFDPLKLILQATLIGDVRLFPATVRNVAYGLSQSPDQKMPIRTIIDAGIHCNLPVAPLLYRNLDIIIIGDFSSDLTNAPELKKAEAYAHKHKLPFPQINYNGISTRTCSIFKDPNGKAPTIVYVPLIKNAGYSASFDPAELMQIGHFMSVLNFYYSLDEARRAAGLMEYTMTELSAELTNLIAQVVVKKAAA